MPATIIRFTSQGSWRFCCGVAHGSQRDRAKSRWKAFLAGMGITALLQNSTATALMSTTWPPRHWHRFRPAHL